MITPSDPPEDPVQLTRLCIKNKNYFLLIGDHLEVLVNEINFDAISPVYSDPAL